MSSVDKLDTSNLDILEVILDVLIVNRVEKIVSDKHLKKTILWLKHIIFLYLNNIEKFEQNFKQTYSELFSLKNNVIYTTRISEQTILNENLKKNFNPFENLNTENPFRKFDIDKFFEDNFKDIKRDKRIYKRGLVYFIKFTPYILLLTYIMETDIDETNIELLKGYIKKYAPDIKTIKTFSSFTQKEKTEKGEVSGSSALNGLVDHIDKNATEYIKLNKLIFDLESKVIAKIEAFQKRVGNNRTRQAFLKIFNKSIEEVKGAIKSNVEKYSLDMIEAYNNLIAYLNVKYIPIPVIEEQGSDMIEKQVKERSDITKPEVSYQDDAIQLKVETNGDKTQHSSPYIPTLQLQNETTFSSASPSPSAREPPIISNTDVQSNSTSSLTEQKEGIPIKLSAEGAPAIPTKDIKPIHQHTEKSVGSAIARPQTAPAIKIAGEIYSYKVFPSPPSPRSLTAEIATDIQQPSNTRTRTFIPIAPGALRINQISNNDEEEQESDEEVDDERDGVNKEEDTKIVRISTLPRLATPPLSTPTSRTSSSTSSVALSSSRSSIVDDDDADDTHQSKNADEKNIKPETKSKTLPYNEEELKQKYLYTQKYKDGIDDAKLNKLLELKSENSDNLYNDQSSNNKIVQLASYIDIFNNKRISDDAATSEDYKDIIAKIRGFENDPKNPLEALEIKFEDRLVFIIATFFIRYVAISMIQRGIDINLITTFYDGFIYYGCIYLVLFWFVVLFINIDDKYTTKYIDTSGFINYIRSLFYYFYMGTNGISRLLIHSLLLIVIIIIPIILNIKNKNNININEDTKDTGDTAPIVMLTLEERTKLSKLLSVFTLFIWILTSIIATKF